MVHTYKSLILLLLSVLLAAASCTMVDLSKGSDVEPLVVTFHPSLDGSVVSKSIGDACQVDQVRIGVFESGQSSLVLKEILTQSWSRVQKEGVSVTLDGNQSYRILFWAEDSDNDAYHIAEDGTVTADYSDYLDSGFSAMEELDAFYATSDIVPGQTDNIRKVILKRPFAQLNFADSNIPERGIHTAKVTFHSIPVSFNPFTGGITATDASKESDDIIFSFADFPSEGLYSDGKEYHYVSCNYIFAPLEGTSKVICTVELEKDGEVVTRHEFKGADALELQQSKKLNMIGYMVPEPAKWSHWDGRFPKVSTLMRDPDDPDCYIIDNAEDLIWLGDEANAISLGKGKTFRLVTNIDMEHRPGQRSMKLPAGSTFDGNGHTIRGVTMMVGLFGDVAVNLTVKNLIIEDAIVTSTTSSNKGIIANSLRGTSMLKDVIVANSSVKTIKGVAGGFVGYVSRVNPSDRSEVMEVVFDGCHLIDTSIEADGYEGYFVGMFRGYDNRETLMFRNNCSITETKGKSELKSGVIEGNEAVWISGTDFSKYDAWLGCEECCRGMLYFEGSRFVAKWDGVRTVTPLLADPVYDDSAEYKVTAGTRYYMIYSPFDLAGARAASSTPNGLFFKESVDMNGQGKDGKYFVPEEFPNRKCASTDDNPFRPFNSINILDGQNNTIYNLSLYSQAYIENNYWSAFIYSAKSGVETEHKNLNFRNCCSVTPVVPGTTDNEQDLSEGAIFILVAGSDKTGSPIYTMDNINIYDSQVFALQHSGLLAGIVSRANVQNCTVNNCYIENYKNTTTHELFEKNLTIAGSDITVSANFYSFGEIGALIGSLRRESNITNCHVRNSIVHAYGDPDKEASMTSDGIVGKLAVATAKGLGFYLVPGRHVSTMIGDIRTINGEAITISGCTVDSATKCTAEYHKHNNSFPYIGQAYYIQFDDTEGTVTVDGQKLTLADGNKHTNR